MLCCVRVFSPIGDGFVPICRIGAVLDTGRFKYGVPLIGDVDGLNMTFLSPDVFVSTSLRVHYNGQKLHEGITEDYVISESGGVGTGYDTVTLNVAPVSGDRVTANYIVSI